MDHPVVVGYNATKPADEALAWAANEAVRRGLPLVVLFAANYPGMTRPPEPGHGELDPGALEAAEEVTRQGTVTATAAHPELDVRGETTALNPTKALLEGSSRASLLVVGSRGRGTISGALLGSVSFGVAAGASCPTVVVTRESVTRPLGPEHPVVVGTDGSPPATSAVHFAADIATESSAALHVVCSTDGESPATADQHQLRDSAENILSSVRATLQHTHPQLTPVTKVTDGAPEQALRDASGHAGLIVVGSRGRGTVKGMVAGSVSFAVIQRVQCPVAVVRGSEPPDERPSPARRAHHPGTPRTGGEHREDSTTVHVGTQRLPGVGWRYTVPADRGRQLLIVVEGTGDRHLVLVDPTLDNPLATIRLNPTTAGIIAALLAGARFHTETPEQ